MILNLESDHSNDEVILVSSLDEQHGGLKWTRDKAPDAGIVRHLRTKRWMLPMLNDAKRNELYMAAIKSAAEKLGPDAVVLDIGTGSGLLAMQAATHAPASAKLVACEMAAPMARMAEVTMKANKLSDRITVLAEQSNSISLDQKAELCISELLDYGLIGEGVIPTMRDAWARLLKPSATVIPSQAKLHVQVVAGGAVPRLSSCAGETVQLQLSAEKAPIAVHSQKLFASGTTALTDPTQGIEFDFRTAEAVPGPAGRTATTRVPVVNAGMAAGVLVWWELEIGADCWYNSNGEWQDHWPQALYPVTEMQVSPGDEIELITAHDDQLLSFELRRVAKKSKPSEEAVTSSQICVSASRVHQLNDVTRLQVLQSGVLDALAVKGKDSSCLDISDGPLCALMAAAGGASCVTSLESGSESMMQQAIHLCEINKISDPDQFRVATGLPQHLQLEHMLKGPANVVMCEPYSERLEGWHIHEALNMFYIARKLREQGLVSDDAVYVPSCARLMARAVQFNTCSDAYRPTETVCGFEHHEFAKAARMHQHDVNLPLWQYAHTTLTEEVELFRFGFDQNTLSDEVNLLETKFVKSGRCDAVVLWVDYNVNTKNPAASGVISTNTDAHSQYVRFLEVPATVIADGASAVSVSLSVGPQANGEDYALSVEVNSGK